ncbi:inositol monophosphatase family protein [Phycicoccus sonneratiae]|uniref:Inositol monophosphatase n=1 Tax=Phycicoccus sonneratiae TaxID=2807628 RepID=A0ABS2CM59_9MICO|nr:inositol monophosphatase [Phycicoccus sonneraticus]MBM6400971.1 inositol monophosphatase [Phycicoccus sonneraticus]
MPGLSTDAVADLLREVAAEVITPRFRSLSEGEVMEKNPGDLVTVADREAEVVITRRLTEAYPDAVVLGEEAFAGDHALMDRYLAADHAFTVDPVDGTKNFVHGSPDHAVMVAEVVRGETVRAWVHQPEHGRTWVAERGSGTFRDGERMRTTPVPDDRAPQGVTSMWSLRDQSLGDLPAMRLSWVCCGVDYPKLVEGATDYIVYSRSNPWDHAPGTLLVTEAGGAVVHPDGSPYGPRSTRPGLVVAVDAHTCRAVQRRAADQFSRA